MMRFKIIGVGRGDKGYTIIELLIVAAIIGILLAIAIPNLIKARISANEANARKSMQTLRDAEGEFFEQDLDNNGQRDFTPYIGGDPVTATTDSLRCPDDAIALGCTEQDALVDNSFVGALNGGADGPGGCDGTDAACADSKAGYCVCWTGDTAGGSNLNAADYGDPALQSDFGWETSMTSSQKTGRRDFGVWGDGVIRCSTTTSVTGSPGQFEVSRDNGDGACD